MIIACGSLNPAKVNALRDASKVYFNNYTIVPVEIGSRVSKMPMSKSETRMGAMNRASDALFISGADLAVAHEGGIANILGETYVFSACVATDGDTFSWGGETLIRLPQCIIAELDGGNVELGDIIEAYTGIANARTYTGATAYLTNNSITREEVFRLHSIMALSFFAFPSNNHSTNN